MLWVMVGKLHRRVNSCDYSFGRKSDSGGKRVPHQVKNNHRGEVLEPNPRVTKTFGFNTT